MKNLERKVPKKKKVERMAQLSNISVEKKNIFWNKEKEGRLLFVLFFEEDILGGGKTHVHIPVYYLYMHKLI